MTQTRFVNVYERPGKTTMPGGVVWYTRASAVRNGWSDVANGIMHRLIVKVTLKPGYRWGFADRVIKEESRD
jgi:hypothetical protein